MSDTLSMILSEKGSNVHTVRPEIAIFQAVAEMNAHRVGSMVVMDRQELVGIFTERDVLTRVIAQELDPRKTPVAAVMTKNPLTLHADATVEDTMEMMRDKRCRHIPIIKDKIMIGLISIGDIVRWVSRMHQYEAENLKAYISGAYL